jgi:DNA-binding response OmpR family regulator
MKQRILVVEDHPNTRTALAYQLRLAGYDVFESPDGETALEMLETNVFAVVLTDIVMGEVSGVEVLHTARIQPYHPAVILLTGHASLDSAIAAVNEGAIAYLLKPCSTDKLLASVEYAVRYYTATQKLSDAVAMLTGQAKEVDSYGLSLSYTSSKPSSSQVTLVIGELSLGRTRHHVTFRGLPFNVTPIEYALLRCLAQKPGQIQSYSTIVRYTHRIEAGEQEAQALLRPHIRNLRKRLGANSIVTERGTGYALMFSIED